MRTLIALLLLVVSSGLDAKTRLLEHVPLQWRATSDLRLGAMQMSAVPVHFEVFKDVRENKEAIGENREDENPKPVTTNDDVGAFVSTHMRELFEQAGLRTADADAPITIQGEVRQFFVRETSTYKSAVSVHLTVLAADGRSLWSGTASGEATRFGRSYKLENYYEVLSDAVVNTVSSMLQSPEFQKALSGTN
jgi:hypothetical protein